MLVQDSIRPYTETRFAPSGRTRATFARHTPKQNHLLAALPLADYERLLPNLEPVPLSLGSTIYDSGSREKYLYFLTAGIVSRIYVMATGASAESAVTGNEGVIGVASFLGGGSTPSQAMVIIAGHAYRVRADLLQNDFDHDGLLLHLLLRYTMALAVQTGQIAACNRHHNLEQKLCRWLLTSLDRLPTNTLTVTHELMAYLLGVRREGVSGAAANLQKAGLIHYSRGHITVIDRPRLEARACECYAVVRREYFRLLPATSTIGNVCDHDTYGQYRTGSAQLEMA